MEAFVIEVATSNDKVTSYVNANHHRTLLTSYVEGAIRWTRRAGAERFLAERPELASKATIVAVTLVKGNRGGLIARRAA